MPPAEQTFLQLVHDAKVVHTMPLMLSMHEGNKLFYQIRQGDPPTMDRRRRTPREPRPDGPRFLQRLLDPDRDHPILRNLIQTIAPIAIAFLTQKLPTWLSGLNLEEFLEADDEEET